MNKKVIQNILNGDTILHAFFKKHRVLLLFIGALVFLYISIVYYAFFQHNKLTELKQQVNVCRGEYITYYCKYASFTRRTHILEELNKRNIDLVENTTMTYMIEE